MRIIANCYQLDNGTEIFALRPAESSGWLSFLKIPPVPNAHRVSPRTRFTPA